MVQFSLIDIKGVGPVLAAALQEKKFSVKKIASASSAQLCAFQGVGPVTAKGIIDAATALLSAPPAKSLKRDLKSAPQEKKSVKSKGKAIKKDKKQKKDGKKKKNKKKKSSKKSKK